MTIFFTWPTLIDVEFRPAYLAETGEEIEEFPKEVDNKFIVGSSRVTKKNIDNLSDQFDGQVNIVV